MNLSADAAVAVVFKPKPAVFDVKPLPNWRVGAALEAPVKLNPVEAAVVFPNNPPPKPLKKIIDFYFKSPNFFCDLNYLCLCLIT